MSATTLPPLEHTGRVKQLHVARSELTKLRTVRSTKWTLAVATVLLIGLPCLVAAIISSHWSSMSLQEQADHARNPLNVVLAGVGAAQLAIAVLAVLTISAEYSTGMIRASFTAVPKRLPMWWGKLGVFAVVTFALSLPAILIAFFATQAIWHARPELHVSLSGNGIARSLVGGAVYLVLVGVFAMGLGAIVRNTAGGISFFAAIFFVIPPLLLLLPSSWRDPIEPYLPGNAGQSIASQHHDSHTLSPGPGALVFVAWCVLAIAIAAILMRRRDT